MNIEFNTDTGRYELTHSGGTVVATYGRYSDALRGLRRRTDI